MHGREAHTRSHWINSHVWAGRWRRVHLAALLRFSTRRYGLAIHADLAAFSVIVRIGKLSKQNWMSFLVNTTIRKRVLTI